MKEALFYEPLADGRVRCDLCPHYCKISRGGRGACGVRYNFEGTLYTLVYDKVVSQHVDSIEKKPFFHFLPGSLSYSIATVGCNFRCLYCQNFEISQAPKEKKPRVTKTGMDDPDVLCASLQEIEDQIPGEETTPEGIVAAAQRRGCESIAYTYTEPTIFFELALDTARLAAAEGLANVFVTNGFTTEPAIRCLAPYLSAATIDLKGFDESAHRKMTAAPLAPVLESIRLYRELGIWIEVTTLVVPGFNDSDEQLHGIAELVCSIGEDVPWHVSQFYPAYRLLARTLTPVETLHRAREIGLRAGLKYVYEGNVPGEAGEGTYCPACKALLIQRYGNHMLENRIREGCCPHCGEGIAGVGLAAR